MERVGHLEGRVQGLEQSLQNLSTGQHQLSERMNAEHALTIGMQEDLCGFVGDFWRDFARINDLQTRRYEALCESLDRHQFLS